MSALTMATLRDRVGAGARRFQLAAGRSAADRPVRRMHRGSAMDPRRCRAGQARKPVPGPDRARLSHAVAGRIAFASTSASCRPTRRRASTTGWTRFAFWRPSSAGARVRLRVILDGVEEKGERPVARQDAQHARNREQREARVDRRSAGADRSSESREVERKAIDMAKPEDERRSARMRPRMRPRSTRWRSIRWSGCRARTLSTPRRPSFNAADQAAANRRQANGSALHGRPRQDRLQGERARARSQPGDKRFNDPAWKTSRPAPEAAAELPRLGRRRQFLMSTRSISNDQDRARVKLIADILVDALSPTNGLSDQSRPR